uniref:BHLH domain-containing protein n=1 Tax=Pygocentrus nattereri TaxID=42514 RepID=A0AAR2IYC6_PYGNA
MTPAVASAMTISKEHLPLNNKLRKPVVEMCRDRINNSIKKLKTLLTPEFLNQQPNSKLDLGDEGQLPEMTAAETACFLHLFNSCPSRLLQMCP